MSKEKSLQELADVGKQRAHRKSWKTFELEYWTQRCFDTWRIITVFGIVSIFPIGLIIVPYFVDDQDAFHDKYFGPYMACLFIPNVLLALLSGITSLDRKKMTDSEKDSYDAKERLYKRRRDISRAKWNMSTVASLFRFNIGSKLVYFILWLATLGMIWPYFRFLNTHETVTLSNWRFGSHSKFNPDEHGGYMAFYIFCIYSIPFLLSLIATPFAWLEARWRSRKEKEWIASLPFPITGYPEILGSGDGKFSFTIAWRGSRPELEFLRNVILGFNKKVTLDKDSAGSYRVTIDFRNGWTARKKNNYKFYRFFHEFVTGILFRLPKENQVTKIEVGYD